MDAEEILSRVSQARRLPPLVAELRDADPNTVFQALFSYAIRAQGIGHGPVAMSAYTLHALNPPCPLPVDDAVARLLGDWDISIEEVPWYLVKQFGREEVLASVERLRAVHTDARAVARLRTIEYWVTAAPAGA